MELVIHIFHGFLGSPKDFFFLEEGNVTLHDIYDLKLNYQISPDDTLIGYSMGGRIALDLARKANYKVKKIILINAHPGLTNEEERLARKIFEKSILDRLKETSIYEFMTFWNALPVFKYDSPIAMNDETRFRQSAEIFYRYLLSEQDNYLEDIIKFKDKILWIIGNQDEKYIKLAQERLIPQGIRVKYMDGGHRLFQKPKELKMILQEENIL